MNTKKVYYPQLDAIRGISVLSVFIFHAYKPILNESTIQKFIAFILAHMGMGLDVFFILSAFLLTYLGMNEFEKTGKFSFKNYFVRRVLRIWPLYFLLMFFSFVILKLVQHYTGQQITLPPPQWYLFFVSNFYYPPHVFFLRLLWTLSVEEQFYILWGICLLFFQKNLKVVIIILSIISTVFIVIQTLRGVGIYLHTLTYIIDMMAGAFAAYSILKKNKLFLYFKELTTAKQIVFYLFFPVMFTLYFFLTLLYNGYLNDLVGEFVRFSFILWIASIIIIQMINEKKIWSLSNNQFLIYTGKISYGLYCFHGFVISFGIIFLQKIGLELPSLLTAIIFLLLTFLVASLSYKFIEKPFLNLKDRLRKV